jgi:8-oxo-dGTP pyrophosphatase MutT (NUDIX family)
MRIIQDWLIENTQPEKKTLPRNSAKCIVLNSKDEILILRCSDGAGFGKWELPGGGIEEGENAQVAVKREVKEETRLQLATPTKIKDLVIKYTESGGNKDVKTTFFRARVEGPDDVYLDNSRVAKDPFYWQQYPKPEHSEYKWIKYKDELERLPMQEQMKEIVIKELQDRYKEAGSDESKNQNKEDKKKEDKK